MTANALYTNHVTTFLCHMAIFFADHVISFLQPTFKNSNGRFTTLVILIVSTAHTYIHTYVHPSMYANVTSIMLVTAYIFEMDIHVLIN